MNEYTAFALARQLGWTVAQALDVPPHLRRLMLALPPQT